MSKYEQVVAGWAEEQAARAAIDAAEAALLQNLEFDSPLICEKASGCDHEAVVLVRSRCCEKSCLYCPEHFQHLKDHVAHYATLTCAKCGRFGHTFDDMAEVFPIRSAS